MSQYGGSAAALSNHLAAFLRCHRCMSQVYHLLSWRVDSLGLFKALSSLLKPRMPLGTLSIYYMSSASPAICYRLKVSVGKYHKFKKSFIAVRVSHPVQPYFTVFFLP